jgi:hypothetical protein
MDTKGLITT